MFDPPHLKQQNSDGQKMLASTLIPQPHSMTHAPLEEDVNMSFGRFVSIYFLYCIFSFGNMGITSMKLSIWTPLYYFGPVF